MIHEAVAEVDVVLSCAVFIRGSLEPHWPSIVSMWTELLDISGRSQLVRYRRGAQAQWNRLSVEPAGAHAVLDRVDTGAGCRWLELAVGDDSDDLRMKSVDLLPVNGEERASHVYVQFPPQAVPTDVIRLAEWSIRNLPLLWGSAGLSFFHINGPRFIAYRRIAAMAKRNWCVQIQDMSTLQWDALHGMPSVNWLTLVGNEFAESKGFGVGAIAAKAAELVNEGVFHRQGAHGLALAAGRQPLLGDINIGEDVSAYARVAELVKPLRLQEHTPLAGPFARPEVMNAWLQRFENPQAWLSCDIAAD
jgi:Protein of unknown function (DUF3396)